MPHIDYVKNDGIQPHFDPFTQECVPEFIDGVKFWKITSYSLDELKEHPIYPEYLVGAVHDKIKTIRELQENEELWNKLSGSTQHNLTAFKNELINMDKNPVGFSIPPHPPFDLSPINDTLPPNKKVVI